jgi:hypothetical protein
VNLGIVVSLGVLSIPLLVLYAKELFPYFLLAPFCSLPLLVILKRQDIGTFSIGFQILALLSGIVILLRNSKFRLFNSASISLILLTVASIYGILIPQTNATPIIVQVLASKSLLLPVVFALVGFAINDHKYICKMVKILFWVCIANSIAGVIELFLGTQKLIALGLPYGTQVREFSTGRVRALGLSLSNFEFSLFSGLTTIICYAVLTKLIFSGLISRTFAAFTLLSAIISMYTSITRQGIFFPLIGIIFLELTRQKNAVRVFSQIYTSFLFILALLAANNIFLRSESFYGRINLWRDLISQNGNFLGNGIGFCGGATTSSYAVNISQIFVDNYYLSVYLQLGVLGLILYLVTIFGFFNNSNRLGKAILLSVLFTSLVTEFWEYTSVISLALILIVTIGLNNPNQKFEDVKS